MAGFIKINRSIEQSWVWQNDRHTWMWLKLKLLEEFEAGEVRLGKSRKKIAYRKGQKAILLKDLCAQLRVSHRALRVFLETLTDEGMIEADIQPKHTVITFLDDNETGNQTGHFSRVKKETAQPTSQLTHNIEEYKDQNNISITTTRAEEIKFIDEAKSDQEFLAFVARESQLDAQSVLKEFEAFCAEMLAVQKFHRNCADFRKHFMHSLRRKIEERRRASKINNTGNEGKFEARRATPPTTGQPAGDDSVF